MLCKNLLHSNYLVITLSSDFLVRILRILLSLSKQVCIVLLLSFFLKRTLEGIVIITKALSRFFKKIFTLVNYFWGLLENYVTSSSLVIRLLVELQSVCRPVNHQKNSAVQRSDGVDYKIKLFTIQTELRFWSQKYLVF